METGAGAETVGVAIMTAGAEAGTSDAAGAEVGSAVAGSAVVSAVLVAAAGAGATPLIPGAGMVGWVAGMSVTSGSLYANPLLQHHGLWC